MSLLCKPYLQNYENEVHSKHLQLASQVCHNYANLFEVHLFEVRDNLQRIVQQSNNKLYLWLMHLKLAPSPVLQSICICTYLHHKQSKSVKHWFCFWWPHKPVQTGFPCSTCFFDMQLRSLYQMTCEVTDIGSMLLTVIMQKYFLQAWRLGVLSALVSTGNYGPIYKNTISPTPLALKQPHILTLLPPGLRLLCGSPGQVHGKHAGLHLRQTNLSLSPPTGNVLAMRFPLFFCKV